MQFPRALKENVLSSLAKYSRRGRWSVQRLVRHFLLGEPQEVVDPGLNAYPFFMKNILFHTHVEKSAGTTLVQSFEILFGTDRVHDIRSPDLKWPAELTAQEKGRMCVLTGHFHYGRMDKFFARRPVYVATVRHPVARFLSYYKYVTARANHPGYAAMAERPFDEIVSEYIKKRHHSISNPMSLKLTGKRALPSDAVIEHVRRNYLMVAPQQRVDELIAVLFEIFKQDHQQHVPRSNVGGYKDEASGRARDMILAANEVDLALYEYACREFEPALEKLVHRLGNPDDLASVA